jgi:hypothetical protein
MHSCACAWGVGAGGSKVVIRGLEGSFDLVLGCCPWFFALPDLTHCCSSSEHSTCLAPSLVAALCRRAVRR